jgi:hypothetical protein
LAAHFALEGRCGLSGPPQLLASDVAWAGTLELFARFCVLGLVTGVVTDALYASLGAPEASRGLRLLFPWACTIDDGERRPANQ